MTNAEFTLDELRAYLERTEQPEGFHSALELMKAWGISRDRVLAVLRLAKDFGILEVRRLPREALDSKITFVPCYKITLGD